MWELLFAVLPFKYFPGAHFLHLEDIESHHFPLKDVPFTHPLHSMRATDHKFILLIVMFTFVSSGHVIPLTLSRLQSVRTIPCTHFVALSIYIVGAMREIFAPSSFADIALQSIWASITSLIMDSRLEGSKMYFTMVDLLLITMTPFM